mmetsp:Transcript_46818/g.94454  ORF Transcript_46818/g.94454 Transcript_46818/m.94454 type:complete len:94 (-) Transcript_46818:1547-1828(-)
MPQAKNTAGPLSLERPQFTQERDDVEKVKPSSQAPQRGPSEPWEHSSDAGTAHLGDRFKFEDSSAASLAVSLEALTKASKVKHDKRLEGRSSS